MQTIASQKSPQTFLAFFSDLFTEKFSHIAEDRSALLSHLTPPPSFKIQPTASSNVASSSDFISAITHELKTPLNAILGFIDILQEEMSSPNPKSREECLSYIKEIKQTAFEMSELVHDLLDVGAINSRNFSVDMSKKIDVYDVVERAVKLNYDYALRRNISLKTEITKALNPINLDAKRLKQILTNLISNSIKYSPQNTEVKISAEIINKKFLEIKIVDQGFGMTESQIEIAFQKYQTISNPNSGAVDSFGLGLPIVKQLTELMNGKIEMKSEVNVGTEVMLKFPLSV